MANKGIPNIEDVARIPEELLPVVRWWQDKGPKTLAYTVAILLLLAIAVYGWTRQTGNRDAAMVALATATQAEEYENAALRGTSVANVARLDLARAYYNAGDYEGALTVYETARKELSDPAIKDIAAIGLVCTLEALGRYDDAMTEIAVLEPAFAASATTHYLMSELILAKARILCQKGDKAAAMLALKPLLEAQEDAVLEKYKPQAERTAKMIEAYVKKDLFQKAAESVPAKAPATTIPAVAPAK
ncbi:MAG: tetratricopeptide repeat protein [Kiritimatiellia bacterium]